VAKTTTCLTRDVLDLWKQWLADDQHDRAGVLQKVAIIRFFQEGVDGHGNRADFQRAEKSVGECRTIQHQHHHAFFGSHVEPIPQRAAKSIDSLEQLGVGDAFVAAFDCDAVATAFCNVSIDEMGGGVEGR
jgi:hypothetical protein